MVNFLLKLEKELHKKAKIKAIQEGQSLHQFMLTAIEKAVSPNSSTGEGVKE